MNLLTYSSTIEKKIHGHSEVYIDALLKKIQGKLKNLQISSDITNHTLQFKRPVQIHYYDREELINPLKNGQIKIKKINSNTIEIFWEVELERLLVLSITIGVVIGIILGLFAESAGLMMISSTIIGLFLSTVTYLFGLNSILTTMNEIVENSV